MESRQSLGSKAILLVMMMVGSILSAGASSSSAAPSVSVVSVSAASAWVRVQVQQNSKAVVPILSDNPGHELVIVPHLAAVAAPPAVAGPPLTAQITTDKTVRDKVIFLSFDDGPSKYTGEILDTLARYHANATFFVIGRQAKAQPKLMQRIHDGGYTIGNHTYDHPSLRGISAKVFAQEVNDTHAVLGADESKCLRPPYGAVDANTAKYARKLGYTLVLWSVDPKDWTRPGRR